MEQSQTTECAPCKQKCTDCSNQATRLYVKSIDYTDEQYDIIKRTLMENAGYSDLQANGTLMSIRMQRKLVNSKIVSSVSDSVIYNGIDGAAQSIREILSAQGIESYIQSSKNYMK